MAEENKVNVMTGNLDKIGQTTSDQTENDARYLKLDQTTPQTVDNGAPIFNKGLEIAANQRVYVDA